MRNYNINTHYFKRSLPVLTKYQPLASRGCKRGWFWLSQEGEHGFQLHGMRDLPPENSRGRDSLEIPYSLFPTAISEGTFLTKNTKLWCWWFLGAQNIFPCSFLPHLLRRKLLCESVNQYKIRSARRKGQETRVQFSKAGSLQFNVLILYT